MEAFFTKGFLRFAKELFKQLTIEFKNRSQLLSAFCKHKFVIIALYIHFICF